MNARVCNFAIGNIPVGSMIVWGFCCFGAWLGVALPVSAQNWERWQIDAEFRSEGVAVADFNRDGLPDIAAGDVWYAAPDWKRHEFRQPLDRSGKPTTAYDGSKGYSNAFASWAYDVNRDGWPDIIVIGYPGNPCHWYENPKGADGHWKEHLIWHSACNETPLFTDLTGNGVPELIFGSQPERQMGFLEIPPVERCTEKWTFTPISEPGVPQENGTFMYYHGLGVGDMNQDGRLDVVIPHGWWEAPVDRHAGPWQFHPLNLSETPDGKPLTAANLIVLDVDLDGDQDIIMSSAHSYGVWWFENPGRNSDDPFKFHLIDKEYSQTHALELVDLYGDGTPTLVTGKRYFAHQGNDPGGRDPVVMYWYDVLRSPGQPPTFRRHEIVAGRDTGVGTQFQITDMNGNGKLDIVLSNKKGVNVLVQSP